MKKHVYTGYYFCKDIFVFILVLMFSILCLTGCFLKEEKNDYDTLLTPVEGLKYRSTVLKVERPTMVAFPMHINDKYEYSRDTHGTHMEHCTEPVFGAAKPFTQDLGAVKQNGKWGYIKLFEDRKVGFEFAIPLQFDGAEPFCGDMAAVKVGDKYGYIGKNSFSGITGKI